MDIKLKKKWVKALRSGKFNQTKNSLQDERGYCCLGVLCEITNSKFSDWNMPTDYQLERKFKLSLDDADFLATLNDSGKSFKYIARYIERTDL